MQTWEKGENLKCHHGLFLLQGSRMPLQRREDHGLVTSPHLAPPRTRCQLRGAGEVRDDFALSPEGSGEAPLPSSGRAVSQRSC